MSTQQKRSSIPQTDMPIYTLEYALKIANGLWDDFAGKSAEPHQLAIALDMSPTSGTWRNLCGSAIAYGLTEGGYGASSIELTALGRRLVAPTIEGDDLDARVEAVLEPRIIREFFQKYDKAKLPKPEIAKNVLVSLGLSKERAESAYEVLSKNGQFAGLVVETKTGPFVSISAAGSRSGLRSAAQLVGDGSVAEPQVANDDDGETVRPLMPVSAPSVAEAAAVPKQLFVAHGKSHGPLKGIKAGLDRFKIPHVVAVEEPHRGRPISQKVADLMKSCSAGIFIFTKDEKFVREDGTEIWRPSENVVFELGAASVLWGQKIIILKEEGVDFPSDFKDLGYIEFSGENAQNVWMSLLTELIALDFIKIQAA